jgi:hypothetical protein
MSLLQHPPFFSAWLNDFEKINSLLLSGYLDHVNDEDITRSHYLAGRYENIYIRQDKIAEVEIVLHTAIAHAATILQLDKNNLHAGLWFNAMQPGHITLAHQHDDDDELLSAVYYISAPENSGELSLRYKNFTTRVTPEAGMFVFFPADIRHAVSKNNSTEIRLSLGINIGPKQAHG